jgi:outer membrane lipoprotein carrier protein
MCRFFSFFNIKNTKKIYGRWCGYSIKAAGIMIYLLLFPSVQAIGGPPPLKDLIAKTQERYEKTVDLKARFIQEVTIKAMNKTDREEGTVYVKNPRRMLWNYSKPKAKKLIINPQNAWLYIPEDRVVYIQDTDTIYKSKLAVKFLSGIGKLGEDFHINFSRPEPADGKGNYLLTLTPFNSDTGIDKMYLTVDQNNFQIIQFSFTDLYGNVTRIRLTDIKINNNLSDKLFSFKPPPNVEIFNMP